MQHLHAQSLFSATRTHAEGSFRLQQQKRNLAACFRSASKNKLPKENMQFLAANV
jgi:hypothetical protein